MIVTEVDGPLQRSIMDPMLLAPKDCTVRVFVNFVFDIYSATMQSSILGKEIFREKRYVDSQFSFLIK